MSEATESIDALLAELSPRASGRLSFHDRCAAFSLLKRGFPQRLVAKVFSVSQATVATLSQCETNPKRYRDVAHEFAQLGAVAFRDRYETVEIADRVKRWRAMLPAPGDFNRGRGADPHADKSAGEWFIPATTNASETSFHVLWIAAEGWAWRQGEYIAPDRHPKSEAAMKAGYFANYGHNNYAPMRPET